MSWNCNVCGYGHISDVISGCPGCGTLDYEGAIAKIAKFDKDEMAALTAVVVVGGAVVVVGGLTYIGIKKLIRWKRATAK